jgi:hypothetical protein
MPPTRRRPTLADLAANAQAAAAPRQPSRSTTRARKALAAVAADAATGHRTVTRAEFEAAQAEDMLEAALQARTVELLDKHGYTSYHTHDSRGSRRGFPDVCAVHPTQIRLIFAELKRQKEDLRPEQRVWARILRALAAAGLPIEYYVWRPSDLLDDTIEDTLRARST